MGEASIEQIGWGTRQIGSIWNKNLGTWEGYDGTIWKPHQRLNVESVYNIVYLTNIIEIVEMQRNLNNLGTSEIVLVL